MNSTSEKQEAEIRKAETLKAEAGRGQVIPEIPEWKRAPAGNPEVGGAASAGKPDWRAALPEAKRRVLVLNATPEQVAAIERILCQEPPAGGHTESETAEGERYVFRRTRRVWEVILGGGRPFHLEDTLGAKYLDYLLHHPNEATSAFDLEVAITPEKGEARFANSIEPQIDARAKREYQQALRDLREGKERAQQAGDSGKACELDGQIQALESALTEAGGTADTGERSRGNVRKAIKLVLRGLLKGGEQERAFAKHVQGALSLGYHCMYSEPAGQVWR